MSTFLLMKQLRPHIKEETYVDQVKQLQLVHGYKLIALSENGVVKAAAGYKISSSLAWGKYLYIDDLITDQESRSRGSLNNYLIGWMKN